MSLCEPKCEFIDYDKQYERSKCECEVKIKIPLMSEISFDTETLLDRFTIQKIININIIKCYKVVYTKDGLINNIGSYILLIIIFINLILLILFIVKGHKNLYKSINKIIAFKYKKKKLIKKIKI